MRYADFPYGIYIVVEGKEPYIAVRAPDLRTSIKYCNLQKGDNDRVRLDIQLPDGTWYEWPKETPLIQAERSWSWTRM